VRFEISGDEEQAMGRLINREKLARAKELRGQRKKKILEEAGSTFVRMAYSEVTLDTIGQFADVERGIASMYFRSKEELFLIVFREKSTEWFDHLEKRLARADGPVGMDDLAALLAGSIAARPALSRLLSLLPVVIEHDMEAMEVFRFQRWRYDRISQIGSLVEQAAPGLKSGQGFDLIYRLQLIAAGLEPAASPRGPAAFDRDDPDFARFWVHLEDELRTMIRAMLP
jgi:AcrR family transcriptional regulator